MRFGEIKPARVSGFGYKAVSFLERVPRLIPYGALPHRLDIDIKRDGVVSADCNTASKENEHPHGKDPC